MQQNRTYCAITISSVYFSIYISSDIKETVDYARLLLDFYARIRM